MGAIINISNLPNLLYDVMCECQLRACSEGKDCRRSVSLACLLQQRCSQSMRMGATISNGKTPLGNRTEDTIQNSGFVSHEDRSSLDCVYV